MPDSLEFYTTEPRYITICNSNEKLVTINLSDGQIEYGPHYTPDEAAKVFWEAIAHRAPGAVEARVRAELREKILDLLK